MDGHIKTDISILQKCFCDVPFHNLTNSFQIEIAEDDWGQMTETEKRRLEHIAHIPLFMENTQ